MTATIHPKTIAKRLQRGWAPDEATGKTYRVPRKTGPPRTITDKPAYMRHYLQQRRQNAKAAGLCTSCAITPAIEGKTKCVHCC